MFYGKEDARYDRQKCVDWFTKEKKQILPLEATHNFISFIKDRPGVINESKKVDPEFKHNNIDLEDDIKGVANCLYTIRCNLFHGDKELYNGSNIKLLQESSKLLNDILKQFIT